jgi:hypothetical protein
MSIAVTLYEDCQNNHVLNLWPIYVTRTHTHTHIHTHARVCARTHTHAPRAHTHRQTYRQTDTQTHRQTDRQTDTDRHTDTQTRTYTQTSARTHTHAHTRTHARAYTMHTQGVLYCKIIHNRGRIPGTYFRNTWCIVNEIFGASSSTCWVDLDCDYCSWRWYELSLVDCWETRRWLKTQQCQQCLMGTWWRKRVSFLYLCMFYKCRI